MKAEHGNPAGAPKRKLIEVALPLEAITPEGFDDAKVRTVSENAATLKFEQGGFEDR